MSASFEHGARVVLILLVAFGAVFAFTTSQTIQRDEEIIAETDARTEYLLERVQDLEARVSRLEE